MKFVWKWILQKVFQRTRVYFLATLESQTWQLVLENLWSILKLHLVVLHCFPNPFHLDAELKYKSWPSIGIQQREIKFLVLSGHWFYDTDLFFPRLQKSFQLLSLFSSISFWKSSWGSLIDFFFFLISVRSLLRIFQDLVRLTEQRTESVLRTVYTLYCIHRNYYFLNFIAICRNSGDDN